MEINWSANEGDKRNMGLITRSEGPLGRGNDNTLQYSFLQHLMDRGSLAGYSLWSHGELNMTEHKHTHLSKTRGYVF